MPPKSKRTALDKDRVWQCVLEETGYLWDKISVNQAEYLYRLTSVLKKSCRVNSDEEDHYKPKKLKAVRSPVVDGDAIENIACRSVSARTSHNGSSTCSKYVTPQKERKLTVFDEQSPTSQLSSPCSVVCTDLGIASDSVLKTDELDKLLFSSPEIFLPPPRLMQEKQVVNSKQAKSSASCGIFSNGEHRLLSESDGSTIGNSSQTSQGEGNGKAASSSDALDLRKQHANCRKNCSNEPYCLASLGFEKWKSGDMDYDWPSDEEEDDDLLIKRKKDVPVGLVNLGATCYVNAFLQLWYHNLAFRNAVFESEEQDADSICGALQYIFGLLELSHRSCVDPSFLIQMLGLDATQQQDAQEFSKLFIDLLPGPQVKSMFSGCYDYVTRCNMCKHESRTPSRFNELDLSIEGLSTLDDCMKSFLQVEKLTGDNQYFCSKCQCKQNATRRIQLRQLPPVLNIQLLRFVFDRKTGHKKKLNTCLQFPDRLELSANGELHDYELTAALMHSGVTAFSGHYTAHIHKQEHWFSFNDTNVVKLKGKKLNLSNEESLDFSPDGSTSNAENRKKGNKSKNAYMLVYQLKSFIQATEVLQPSPVPQKIVERVEEDNAKLALSMHDTEMKQTEQMVKVDMKKDQLAEIWNGLAPSDEPDENYHFLPLSWLHDSLKDWDDIRPIDTSPLLCRHGKLNWSLSNKYKIISQVKGEEIYKKYSDGKTVVLNRKDSLCYECLKNQLKWRCYKERVEEDHKKIQALLSAKPTNTETSPVRCKMYWLSKSDLRKWRSLVLKPLEMAAHPTDKTAKDVEKKTGEDNLVTSTNQSSADACDVNGAAGSEGPMNGEAESADDQSDDRFNADIQCDHGCLDNHEKYRQLVPEDVWNILTAYFPEAITFSETDPVCARCLGELVEIGAMEEQRKAYVKQEKQVLSDLAVLKNRPILNALTTNTVYCITASTYKHWKLFLRNPLTQSGLESIVNRSVICMHGMLCVHPSDDSSLVLLWPYEWDVLSSHFPPDQVITVNKQSVEDGVEGVVAPYATDPKICEECSQSRLLCEEMESHNFSHSLIYIRLMDGEKDDANVSLNPLNVDDDMAQPDTKKAKMEQVSVKRRSERTKRIRGDKQLRVSSNITLKQLRIELVKLYAIAPFDQVISLDGKQLEGDDKTLAEHRLYPGCLLFLKGVMYDEFNMEQSILLQSIPEEGFRGTGLVASTSS